MAHKRQLLLSPQISSQASISQSGFTLIELVIGIVVFAVAMTMLTSLIFPQAQRSVDPIYQLRATELANTLLNEIQGKAFDENSNLSLGLTRCDEDVATNPCSVVLAAEEASRDLWDDVDDYHGLTISGQHLSVNQSYQELYLNYQLEVAVFYDGDYDGADEGSNIGQRGAKLITVKVITPADEALDFAAYRSNY